MKHKDLILKLIVLVGCILVFIGLNFWIDFYYYNWIDIKNDRYRSCYEIEKINHEGDYLYIDGWYIQLKKLMNQETDTKQPTQMRMALLEINEVEKAKSTGEKIKAVVSDIEISNRSDVNNYFECEFNYSDCGIHSGFKLSDINSSNLTYQIFILPDADSQDAMETNYYIYDNKLYGYNPESFIEPDVKETDLSYIVNDGVLKYFNPEYGIYLYQYQRKIYTLLEKVDLGFPTNTFQEYFTFTNQIEKVPNNLLTGNGTRINYGAYFEERELTGKINCGKYRVSVSDIPTEYAVTHLQMGHYENDDWIWSAVIRPNYREFFMNNNN